MANFELPGPVPVSAQPARAEVAGPIPAVSAPGETRSPRLDRESAGESIVSRYLAGEADPLKKDDFEAAAADFDAARELAPESVWLLSRCTFAHGRALIFDRQYEQAISLLDRSIQLDPSSAIAYNALGIAYLESRIIHARWPLSETR